MRAVKIMEGIPLEVPVCPSGFALVLLDKGWRWSANDLHRAVAWLQGQHICDENSVTGVELADLEGLEQWEPEVPCAVH